LDSCKSSDGSCLYVPDDTFCHKIQCSSSKCTPTMSNSPGCTPCECTSPINCLGGSDCTTPLCSDGKCSYQLDASLCSQKACQNVTGCTLAGGCQYTPVLCNDNNDCTNDLCDVQTNACQFIPDDSICASTDLCRTGSCQSGESKGCSYIQKNCDDSISCTTDSCSSPSGQCVNVETIECDYLNTTCSVGVCDKVQNVCFSQMDPTLCNDGKVCTNDVCGVSGCSFTTVVCPQDGSGCTFDEGCVEGVGCVYTPVNDNCPSQTCMDATCTPTGCIYQKRNCDGGDACKTYHCDMSSGDCVSVDNLQLCNDLLVCTTDQCISIGNGNYDCKYTADTALNCPISVGCANVLCTIEKDCVAEPDNAVCPTTLATSCNIPECDLTATPGGCNYIDTCVGTSCGNNCHSCSCAFSINCPTTDKYCCQPTCPAKRSISEESSAFEVPNGGEVMMMPVAVLLLMIGLLPFILM